MATPKAPRTYELRQVDVFTDAAYVGNPLAVILDADDLTEEQMLRIAREMNLSETTFVQRPTTPPADYRVRIFLVSGEIPFAGHPSVGTAFVMASEGRLKPTSPTTLYHQEVGIGVLPVEIQWEGSNPGNIICTAGEPKYGEVIEDVDGLAARLGVPPEEIRGSGLAPQLASAGGSGLMVPIKSLEAVANLKPDRPRLGEFGSRHGFRGCYVLSLETRSPETLAHCRSIGPGGGWEDPATGSAAAGLGAYLFHHGVLSKEQNPTTFNVEQGEEAGRPSRIYVEVTHEDGQAKLIRIGGRSVPVFQGQINAPPL